MTQIAGDAAYAVEETAPGLVASVVYEKGGRVGDIAIEEAGARARQPGAVVWIGLFEPSLDLLRRVQRQFDLHPLAIEDAERAHQATKVEQYGDSLFIAARTARIVDEKVAFGETQIFVGPGYVVTVRHGASQSYAAVRKRCEARPKELSEGEDYILYCLLDFIVDNFFPVLDALHGEVESIEDAVFEAALATSQIKRLYDLRRDLLRLRNAAAPLVDVCARIERSEVVPIDPAMRLHFRDVTDHVRRIVERIDTLREVLAFAFEASLMLGQMQQNDITRRLTAWAAILAVPTAIAGIYGMNFKYMPELEWRWGYFAALGFILVVCSGLYRRFRRLGWL